MLGRSLVWREEGRKLSGLSTSTSSQELEHDDGILIYEYKREEITSSKSTKLGSQD